MNLSDMSPRMWEENVLFTVLVELTYACNLDCFFCYNDRAIKGKPLSLEEYFRFMEDLRDMQVLNLVLTGGEPLAHPDFFKIGAKARELGFVVRIKSNGHALTHRLASRLKREVDPFGIDISLHGATAETHDRQTQVPGSFDRLMKNFQVLKDLGLRFRLNGTLTSWNEHEIEGMFDIATHWNVSFNMSSAVTPRDNGDQEPLSISPSASAIEKAFSVTVRGNETVSGQASENESAKPKVHLDKCESESSGRKQCGTGSSTLTIDPMGNIYPCVQWRRPIGNLHDDSVKDLWTSSPDLEDVRLTAVKARQLVESYGTGGRLMNYCIGEAVCQTGSALSIYPIAQRHMDNRLKVLIK
ncbi:radical SAM/SPASM domain-containing protein [Pseudomonadota bacterium]